MTNEELERFYLALTSLRDGLMGKGPKPIEPNRKDETKVGADEDEQPLNEMLQSISSNRNRNASAILVLIDKALAKIREQPDEFGLCEECGDELGARLKAIPYAEYCLDCQSKKDKPKGPQTRRNLYDYR